MNCEQVFEILTRGPFPTGAAHDQAVERHLAGCHECRQLAEALRPAVELFHESVTPEEGDLLPAYQGALCRPERTSLPAAVAAAIEASRPQPVGTPGWWRQLSFSPSGARLLAAAASLAIILWGLVGSIEPVGGGSPRSGVGQENLAVQVPPAQRYQPDEPGQLVLASLNLPSDCGPSGRSTAAARWSDAGSMLAAGTGSVRGYLCCTQCHSAAKPQRAAPEVLAMLTTHCSACHRN